MKYIKWHHLPLWLVIFLSLVVIVGCGKGEQTKIAATNTSNTGSIGDTLRIDGVTFRVDEVHKEDNKIQNSSAQDQQALFLKVFIDYDKLNRQPIVLVGPVFALTDSEGISYEPIPPEFVNNSLYDSGKLVGRPALLRLEETAQGLIGFYVGNNSSNFTLTYHVQILESM